MLKAIHGEPQFDRQSGRAETLGAEFDGEGTNFALFSENATGVDLCLFDDTGKTEVQRMALPDMEGGIWHGYLPGIKPGQLYGYRVHGPHAPESGHRFNAAKLLLDPYARQTRGPLIWDDALYGYPVGGSDLDRDDRDSAGFMPKAVVVDAAFDWEADAALNTRWEDTFLYEAHVKGLTMLHPNVPEADRGTFAGLGSQPIIDHLKSIGVSAIELLPVQGFVNDRHLQEKGLSNYWGYNSLSFFAPQSSYLKSGDIREVKRAIRRFHDAGIEVILDVVYNHTAEGNEMGASLSFRGIDNAVYYLSSPDNPRHGFDVTGTGNTLNVAHPMVLRMVLDSLRYWVQVMHVDGFRFDLASTLGREQTGFERDGAFFAAIKQDPVLSKVKLIAEPWDIGAGGYQVGGFPWPFREWNDKFRDDVRGFWRRNEACAAPLSERLLGSPVQFNHSQRPATSSVNFLAAHDGFTLWDTVSFNDKHNEANGEDGKDGHDNNLSDNMGIEGATEDDGVNPSRARRVKAMLATLLLSQGVPMILAGDELGQSQNGNNNAYCQDNDLAWIRWDGAREDLREAVAALAALRKDLALAQAAFALAPQDAEDSQPAASWWHASGREFQEGDWTPDLTCLGLYLRMQNAPDRLIIINGGDDTVVNLPEGRWTHRLDTAAETIALDAKVEGTLKVGWQSVHVLLSDAA